MKAQGIRVDLRWTNLSRGLRLVEFAELDEGVPFNGALPEEYGIHYRVESIWHTGSPAAEIVDYSCEGLDPNVLRHLDWIEK